MPVTTPWAMRLNAAGSPVWRPATETTQAPRATIAIVRKPVASGSIALETDGSAAEDGRYQTQNDIEIGRRNAWPAQI